jgi:hypothetical protein
MAVVWQHVIQEWSSSSSLVWVFTKLELCRRIEVVLVGSSQVPKIDIVDEFFFCGKSSGEKWQGPVRESHAPKTCLMNQIAISPAACKRVRYDQRSYLVDTCSVVVSHKHRCYTGEQNINYINPILVKKCIKQPLGK